MNFLVRMVMESLMIGLEGYCSLDLIREGVRWGGEVERI